MRVKGGYNILLCWLATVIICHGCIKEYSYEGGNPPPAIIDTLRPAPTPVGEIASCNNCAGKDQLEDWRWSFKVGDSLFCGIIDTALINLERTSFTFFGPSACSHEVHMIITVYMAPTILNRSYQDLLIPNIVFYFNRWGAMHHLLVTRWGTPFSLNIDSYDHSTRITTGTFYGQVYRPDGSKVQLHSGKFKFRLN